MKMQRGWPDIPDRNREELEHILSLLETEFPFEIAILYGRYAGGRMRSEQEGYELLLVTQGEPGREGWELEEYLKGKYPTVSRTEWTLHIETVDIHTLNNTNTSNWFFWNIRMEGTIIRDSGKTQGIFRKTQFRHGKAYKLARRQYDHFFTNGSDMLDEAVRMWNAGKPSLAAIDLSYAAQFLLRAEETVFYGNFIHTPNLQKSFRRARVFSKRLLEEFPLDKRHNTEFFDQLVGLRHAPRNYTDFEFPKWRYLRILGRLRRLQDIVRESCERHLFYLEHGKTQHQMEQEAMAKQEKERAAAGSTTPGLAEECDNNIYKEDMKRFMEKLQQEAHWLYALIHHSPRQAVSIFFEDIRKDDVYRISVMDFEKQYDSFHPQKAVFVIHFRMYHFQDEDPASDAGNPAAMLGDNEEDALELLNTDELDCAAVLDAAPHILAHICRLAIRNGSPLELDEATVVKYGFTPEDIALLQERISETNARLLEEFNAEYEYLRRIVKH